MREGPQHIGLFGPPGTDVSMLACQLRKTLAQHPDVEISTPALPEAGLSLVLLLALNTQASPSESRAAQIAADNALRAQLHALALPYRVVHGQGETALNNALLAMGLTAMDVQTQTVREQAQFDLNRGRTPWSCEKCSDPECEHRLFTGLLAGR